ncbi:MAG: hypothetical protein F4137_23800 [Acidobacteria bacterium]|nr:hypothetical protein [Acidobacteriota bacterium]
MASLFAATVVAAQSTSTATVEVRVWRNVADPERLHLSTRPADGRWITHETPLDMRELSRSGSWHQSSIISVDVEVPVETPIGPGASLPPQLTGIDDSARCAALLALVAEHLAETTSVVSCEAFEHANGTSLLRGVVLHRDVISNFTGVWSEADGLIHLNWQRAHSYPLMHSICWDAVARFGDTYAPVAFWDCVTRLTVVDSSKPRGEPPQPEWTLLGSIVDTAGVRWGFEARVPDGEREPTSFEVSGAKESRFHGIDETPQCEALVAFIAEHFAETTSVTSCAGHEGSHSFMRGLLEHRDETAAFEGSWSAEDGVSRLSWVPVSTDVFLSRMCQHTRAWIIDQTGIGTAYCYSARASVRFDDGPIRADWTVLGTSTSSELDDTLFHAIVQDGDSAPWVYRTFDASEAGWVYPEAE